MPLYEKYTNRNRDDFVTLEDLQKNYKLNIPDNFNFVFDCLDVMAAETPDALAMLWLSNTGEEKRFTFEDIRRLSVKAANFFIAQGIEKGDMVMLTMSRDWRYWPVLMGLHRMGAVAVPATYLLTKKDMEYRMNSASIKMLLTTPRFGVITAMEEALPNCPTVKKLAVFGGKVPNEKWIDFDAQLEAAPETPVARNNIKSDMMLMAFSSGTTGYPKMVWHDYTYPLGHIMTGCFWHRCEKGGLHFTISDTGWLKSLWGKMYSQWLAGSAIFTYDFDKFSATDILEKIEKYKINTFCAPPTMYRFLIKEDLKKYNFSALHHCTTAGEALNPEVFRVWHEGTGLKIFEGFGQSETTICCWTGYPWMQPRLGSMGLPVPGYRMIIADDCGKEVSPGVIGEICIRTDEAGGGKPYGMFSGYFCDDEMTKSVWYDDLYHTGDTAYKDEMGFLWYVGRTDDVIKSSGYRIGPFEVESVLMEHPAVTECAVTGVPDPERGFAVKATIVLSKGYTSSPELTKELQNHVKKITAPYKYPRIVEYVDALPKTISGKIRRVEIRSNDNAKAGEEKK
ncbi:MAG: AMP-binding protein [Endomicrobia bacterium]|nr:AMP-binding protein [Endomicrobiia bacterium]MCL2507152.1 AMP-binding protein [Endomicrobiia bacterium]